MTTNSTTTKDIFEDVFLLSFSDYCADTGNDNDDHALSTESLDDDYSQMIEESDPLPMPLSLSESRKIIKSDFTSLIFCDYENSYETADSLEAHFQKSSSHSFSSSSLSELEKWERKQSYK